MTWNGATIILLLIWAYLEFAMFVCECLSIGDKLPPKDGDNDNERDA